MSARNRSGVVGVVVWVALLFPAVRMGAQVYEPGAEPPHAHDPDPWQETLGCSDEDWPAIEPRLEKVLALRSTPYGPAVQRLRELHHLTKHDARADLIMDKLESFRQARDEADLYLAQAEADLRQILTVRQEATLVVLGVLD